MNSESRQVSIAVESLTSSQCYANCGTLNGSWFPEWPNSLVQPEFETRSIVSFFSSSYATKNHLKNF